MSLRNLLIKFNVNDSQEFRDYIGKKTDREVLCALVQIADDEVLTEEILRWGPFSPSGKYVAALPCKFLGVKIASKSADRLRLPGIPDCDDKYKFGHFEMGVNDYESSLCPGEHFKLTKLCSRRSIRVSFNGPIHNITYKFRKLSCGFYEYVAKTCNDSEVSGCTRYSHGSKESFKAFRDGNTIEQRFGLPGEPIAARLFNGVIISAYIEGMDYKLGDLPEGIVMYARNADHIVREDGRMIDYHWNRECRYWESY